MSGAMRGAVVRTPINSNDRPNAVHREWKRIDVTNEMRMLNHEMQYRSKEVWKMAQAQHEMPSESCVALAHVLTAVRK